MKRKTGFFDKNNVEITEDDYVDVEGKGIERVMMYDGDWAFGDGEDFYRWIKKCYQHLYEIVGNYEEDRDIYEGKH